MKHRILAAMICVCAALTSLCVPALADDTEAETPVPVEATPAPAETTPAPVMEPVEETVGASVEEMTAQPLGAANVPSVRANWNDPKINGVFLEAGTYYKNDPSDNRGFSEATADDYNFYFDGTTLFLRNADLKGTGNQPMGSALLSVFIPLVIDLTGENRFSVNTSYYPIIAQNITIRGSGSLTLVGGTANITRLTMESGTFITDDLRPSSTSAEGKGLYFNGGCFTANQHFGGQMGLYIGAEFYRWKTDLSRDYMPSIFETCPYPGGMPLSLVQMDDPFRSKLRVNPATNEWEVSYDSGTTWKSLGVKATGEDGKDGRDGRTPSVGPNGNGWIGSMDTGVKAAGTDVRDGTDGKHGVDGKNGTDGLTPVIGENGNWWIGDTDTGVKAGGADGKDGADGLTPVIGENGNWWIGDTDTGVKAAAADGKDGANGKDGVDGKDGTDGAQGAPGLTLSIGGNGNWWLGNTDTGVRAAGTTGATGAAGAAGATGATGAAGRNGTDGKDGKDGVGIREVSLNDSGELIVTLTDGTETNLGKITGEDGAPGVGISSVQVGENGMLTVTLSNGESVEAGAVFSAQEGKTVRTVSYITAAAAALAFLWLAVLTTLFAKSRRTAVHR